MIESSRHDRITASLVARMQDQASGLVIPPPAFLAMEGEFVSFDEDNQRLVARFPVLDRHLNPFGTMQGGFLAAAVDNTVGPLSLLVGPASVTRRIEMKYSRPVSSESGSIRVEAWLAGRKKRLLHLEATVLDEQGIKVASGKAVHWIIDGVD